MNNLYFIGFEGLYSSFRPVEAKNIHEAKTKFAEYHKVPRSNGIVASRNYEEMSQRYKKLIR